MNLRLLVLFVMLFPVNLYAKDIDVAIYVDDSYSPLSYVEKGKAKGMYIDVLNAVFSKMEGFNVTMKPVPWKRGKHIMEKGEGFGLAPAFFHGHDWPYLYPYSAPFYIETIITVCDKKILEEYRPRWPEDYQGLKIGNIAGFDGWGGEKFRAMVKDGKMGYMEAHGSDKLIRALLMRACDCIMMEDKSFDFEISRLKRTGIYNEKIHPVYRKGAIVGIDPVYIGFSELAIKNGKHRYEYEFRKKFDAIIYRMIKSGERDRIMESYTE